MNNLKIIFLLISCSLFTTIGNTTTNNIWNDISQDSIQLSSPIEFIDTYNKYTVISKNQKIRLTDYGNIDKNKNGITYTLKNYGVQILNKKNIFNIFNTTVPLNSNVDFNLLYRDKNIVAFRIRENSTVDYVKRPFRSFIVDTYVYNLNTNKFSIIQVINSDGEKNVDLLQGDKFSFNKGKGIYTYIANIELANTKKIDVLKVDLNSELKCVYATQGCDNIGYSLAEINK